MIQSLLYQVPFFQIPPSRAFFPEQYRCVWRWTWPDAAGRNGGARSREQVLVLLPLLAAAPLPDVEVSSGQAEVSSVWPSHTSEESLKTQPPLPLTACGPACNLQLI